jgi:hypothetical protein
MLFSLSAIVIGIELPQTGYGARTIKLLVAVFITAIIVWTLSGLKQMRWVMGLCDLVFVAVIIMTAWGVATR